MVTKRTLHKKTIIGFCNAQCHGMDAQIVIKHEMALIVATSVILSNACMRLDLQHN